MHPEMVYVNDTALSQDMYHRLCCNPSQAIVVCDKYNDPDTKKSQISCIYNGYDIRNYGISTMFSQIPSLSECQSIWKEELIKLKQECIENSSIIIMESNPSTVSLDSDDILALSVSLKPDLF